MAQEGGVLELGMGMESSACKRPPPVVKQTHRVWIYSGPVKYFHSARRLHTIHSYSLQSALRVRAHQSLFVLYHCSMTTSTQLRLSRDFP